MAALLHQGCAAGRKVGDELKLDPRDEAEAAALEDAVAIAELHVFAAKYDRLAGQVVDELDASDYG